MDVILILVCFWPEMQSWRLTCATIFVMACAISGLGVMLSGEMRLTMIVFMVAPIALWLVVEIYYASRAWKHIDQMYCDRQYLEYLTNYEAMADWTEDYGESQGPNLLPEDFDFPFDSD